MTSSSTSEAMQMASCEPSEGVPRPSFTSFWKRTKQKLYGNRVEFVQSEKKGRSISNKSSSESPKGSSNSPSSSKNLTATEKAKIRRAQVRRAQIQHRQRKVEYVKKLELDVTHFRELIALTEDEAAELSKENSAMRAQLQLVGITISVKTPGPTPALPAPMDGVEEQIDLIQSPEESRALEQVPDMFGDINIDDMIVTLKKDDELSTPVFSVRSSSSESNKVPDPQSALTTSRRRSVFTSNLSKDEEQVAINFILSMEHICWDHFWLGDYPHHEYQSDEFKGHTLMASTFCMARAPQCVYRDRKGITGASGCGTQRGLGMKSSHVPAVYYEWPSRRISLSSLHGLASSLNPGDIELTPVQAWFELADRYPKDVLMNQQLLHSLSCELNGVVQCLEFGAVMERQAFESVVGRVLGPSLESTAVPTITAT